MVRPSANRIWNAEIRSRGTEVATGIRAVTPGTPLHEPAADSCPSTSTTARSYGTDVRMSSSYEQITVIAVPQRLSSNSRVACIGPGITCASGTVSSGTADGADEVGGYADEVVGAADEVVGAAEAAPLPAAE